MSKSKYQYTQVAQHGIPAGVKLTDMMKQYIDAKSRYPQALLFFRMGDFYELFFEDAELAGRHLGLTVTSRNKKADVSEPMSGFPHHQMQAYLKKALAAGFKVSICDQLTDPKESKGVVERGITQVVTPGVILEGDGIAARSNHYLLAILPQCHPQQYTDTAANAMCFGVAALDVSSALFQVTEVVGIGSLRCEISRLEAKELLLPQGFDSLTQTLNTFCPQSTLTPLDHSFFDLDQAQDMLSSLKTAVGQMAVPGIQEYGFNFVELPIIAAGACMAYVCDMQKKKPTNLHTILPYHMQETVIIDENASEHLELFKTLMGKKKKGSLLGVLDRASTAMGARRIKRWLTYPLITIEAIEKRLDYVEYLKDHPLLRQEIRVLLKKISDIERLNTRAALGKSNPREVGHIRDSLSCVPELKALLQGIDRLAYVNQRLNPFPELSTLLQTSLREQLPTVMKDGLIIQVGFDKELDELVNIVEHGDQWLRNLEQREKERTGIASLKVRFNKVFGYYIEISKANLHLIPQNYQRRQTLTNAERFITQELKEFEEKVLSAEGRRNHLESELFNALRQEVAQKSSDISLLAESIADLDAWCALAEVAHQYDYCRPKMTVSDRLLIQAGRHPVVEHSVGRESFIPNNILLDHATQRLMIITGPNMAGKSTVMRQVALITLMAQMGSFVPAEMAEIGVIDRIFTRVGASDDLSSGRSTFMVEMSETAHILNEATHKSLIILDEIGRGTSTFDGVSIAWSVAEYLHDHIQARCLFATHYHELTELADMREAVKNYSVAVSHSEEEIVFLHQLVPGGSSRSYGIQVAELAGLPGSVVERAHNVLDILETHGDYEGTSPTGKGKNEIRAQGQQESMQLSLFSPPALSSAPSEVERMLKALDLNKMTPMQAFNFLHKVVEKAKKS
jgi:DNA mismatch repair protein MutS